MKSPAQLYGKYIERGDVENRIKELKFDLASGRTSCHRFLAEVVVLTPARYRLCADAGAKKGA